MGGKMSMRIASMARPPPHTRATTTIRMLMGWRIAVWMGFIRVPPRVPILPSALPAVAVLGDCVAPGTVLQGPIISGSSPGEGLPAEQPTADDQPLPINLATALRLADARPLVIAAAEASVRQAAAALAL